MFICREKELNELNKRYSSNNFECAIIYGRRRIGKTALIQEFCKDKKNVIFYSAIKGNTYDNLILLSKAMLMDNNRIEDNYPIYKSFEACFDELYIRSKNDRVIFVIDEVPYIAGEDKKFLSVLQHYIDHKFINTKLFIILCGSSISFMESEVLGSKSPIYGRRTLQFNIQPFDYKETAVFNKKLSEKINSIIYGVTGGVPHYINKLNVKDDIGEAIIENILEPSSYLFEEPMNLLKQELREPSVYNSIILAIAEGASKLNEIVTKVHMETGLCTKYINTLIALRICERIHPVGETFNSKKTIYIIKDNFFRFWYKYVLPNMSLLYSGKKRLVYEKIIKDDLHNFMGKIFEDMARCYLVKYADVPFLIKDIGEWWGANKKEKKEAQIDIVGLSTSKEKSMLFGSCKYRNQEVDSVDIEELIESSKLINNSKKSYYYIFSKSKLCAKAKQMATENNVLCITLKDMYK